MPEMSVGLLPLSGVGVSDRRNRIKNTRLPGAHSNGVQTLISQAGDGSLFLAVRESSGGGANGFLSDGDVWDDANTWDDARITG
jgi:hypothetical protein